MKIRYACAVSLVAVGLRLAAAPPIAASAAPQWKACPSWVSRPPTVYAVRETDGLLVFSAAGAGTEMAWILGVGDRGPSGDERYLLVRYRASGLSTRPGVYFLHGEEGTRGGRAYAMADQLAVDGTWQTLAVDLVAINPLEVTYNLAVKVAVADTGQAELAVEKLWFGDELPAGARLAALPPQPPDEKLTVVWPAADQVRPQPGWTTTPASRFAATKDGAAMSFVVSSRPQPWALAVSVEYQTRPAAWPAGTAGFDTLTARVSGGQPSAFLMQTASLALAGVTIHRGEPRFAEPGWEALDYAPPAPGALPALRPLRSSLPGSPLVPAGRGQPPDPRRLDHLPGPLERRPGAARRAFHRSAALRVPGLQAAPHHLLRPEPGRQLVAAEVPLLQRRGLPHRRAQSTGPGRAGAGVPAPGSAAPVRPPRRRGQASG